MLNLGCERELRWRLSNVEHLMQCEQQKYGMSTELLETETRSTLTRDDPVDPLNEDLGKRIRTSGQPESQTTGPTAPIESWCRESNSMILEILE
jgi:hypothetical protein